MSGAAACDRSAPAPDPFSRPVEGPTDPEEGKAASTESFHLKFRR